MGVYGLVYFSEVKVVFHLHPSLLVLPCDGEMGCHGWVIISVLREVEVAPKNVVDSIIDVEHGLEVIIGLIRWDVDIYYIDGQKLFVERIKSQQLGSALGDIYVVCFVI
jgi:hypothetical protein